MMVAVLLGALSLGACVEDNESASVTAVRDAKAKQLESIAAMNNAEAQAKLIYAEAEAQLKAAEAALKQALADKAAAEALIKELEAQMAQDAYDAELAARLAAAEQARLEAEAAIARVDGELQYYQKDLEKRIAELQLELMQAQMNLENKADNIADQEMARLNKLAKNYSTLLYSVTEEQQSLASLETAKLSLEAGLADWEASKEQTIAENNAKIELIDKQIALYQEYENYTADVQALQDERTLKVAEQNQVNDEVNAIWNDYIEKRDALTNDTKLAEMRQAIENNELIKMRDASWDDENYTYTRSHWGYDWQGNWSEIIDAQIVFYWYNPVGSFGSTTEQVGKEGYDNTCSVTVLDMSVYTPDLRWLEIEVKNELAYWDTEALEDAINNEETGTKVLLDAAKKATEEAKKAWDAAPDDAEKQGAYQQALIEEEMAQANYNQSVSNLENAEANIDKLNTLYALVTSSTADLEKAVEDYNAAVLEAATDMVDTYFAYYDAMDVYNELGAEIAAIDAVLGQDVQQITLYEYIINQIGSNYYLTGEVDVKVYDYNGIAYDYPTFIDMWNIMLTSTNVTSNGALQIQTLIEALESEKAQLVAANEDYSEATIKENLIEMKQAEIDGKKAVIEALEIEMNQAKARLDAAIAEYSEEPAA